VEKKTKESSPQGRENSLTTKKTENKIQKKDLPEHEARCLKLKIVLEGWEKKAKLNFSMESPGREGPGNFSKKKCRGDLLQDKRENWLKKEVKITNQGRQNLEDQRRSQKVKCGA